MRKDLPEHAPNLIGTSSRFKQVVAQIQRLSEVDATVLISGESGTGKEVAARAIHYLSERRDRPFVPVNCGAISEHLVESELFGHERGAFTDAKVTYQGLVGEADGGTLMLDEVDALSLKAQAALLRFLQDHSYRRLGSGVQRQADVRVLVASNADLEALVKARLFRQDLLYRLNVLSLEMPPLRERGSDAVELAGAFLARLARRYRMPNKALHPDAVAFIAQYRWPGNVRELENVVHRDFLMCRQSELTLEDARLRLAADTRSTAVCAAGTRFKEAKARAVAEFERLYVREILALAEGNLSAAARLAGKDRSAFGKLVRKYRIAQWPLRREASPG
ncbi:MAG TPA: sigma-54 dependent transcriptional regulator [Rhodocyclaceae bacterium]